MDIQWNRFQTVLHLVEYVLQSIPNKQRLQRTPVVHAFIPDMTSIDDFALWRPGRCKVRTLKEIFNLHLWQTIFLCSFAMCLAWITLTRMTPPCDEYNCGNERQSVFFCIKIFWSQNKYGHNECTPACDYSSLVTSTLLDIDTLMTYMLMLEDTEGVWYRFSQVFNTYATLISLEGTCIYRQDPTLHCTPPNGVYSYSCTANHLFKRLCYNW